MYKVLVTGADGFIGSHLCEYLLGKNYSIRALVQYNSFDSWGWLDKVKTNNKELEIITGDIRDPMCCDQITKNIDIIFNLASLISIPYSYKAPLSYIKTNIEGTVNLCNSALKNKKIKKFLHISTSEVYGSALSVPITETHPLQPQSPYSASKISSEMMALSYFYSFNLPVLIVRPFNTYGPRQSLRAIIPTIISQILRKNTVLNLGNIHSTRDFNFVTDTCDALFKISKAKKFPEPRFINIGSNSEISIKDLVNKIKFLMDSKIKITEKKNRFRPSKSEVNRLKCDNSELKKLIKFTPKYNLDDGLKLTIDWLRKDINKINKSNIYNV